MPWRITSIVLLAKPSLKIVRPVPLSQTECQQTWGCQQRNPRIRGVERGQWAQSPWLSSHPGRARFELENCPETQILAYVWDTGGRADRKAVNEIGRRKVRGWKNGSPTWIRTTINGSKGRCPTVRRSGNGRAGYEAILAQVYPDLLRKRDSLARLAITERSPHARLGHRRALSGPARRAPLCRPSRTPRGAHAWRYPFRALPARWCCPGHAAAGRAP